MSALGLFLLDARFELSASDLNPGEYLEKLREGGAEVWVGSQPQKIPQGAVVFYSSAISPSDPEMREARDRGMEVFPRHLLLRYLTARYYTIAVSGTHGKTTTTAWVAWLLERGGYEPSALVGGSVHAWGSNVRIGQLSKQIGRPLLVIEADESDGSFLDIVASMAIVTNIDLDHVDRYHSLDEVERQFQKFIHFENQAQGNHPMQEEKEDKYFIPSLESIRLLDRQPHTKTPHDPPGLQTVKEILTQISIDVAENAIVYKDTTFKVGLLGQHNLYNATAVAACALCLGIPYQVIAEALLNFSGVGRRMETLFQTQTPAGIEVRIVDDYAHHPNEIEAVLKTYHSGGYSVVPYWEPHRVSRFCAFQKEYSQLFHGELRETLTMFPVFDAAGEEASGKFPQFRQLYEAFSQNRLVSPQGSPTLSGDTLEEAAQEIASSIGKAAQDTVFLFMGAGHSSKYAHHIAELVKEKIDKRKNI